MIGRGWSDPPLRLEEAVPRLLTLVVSPFFLVLVSPLLVHWSSFEPFLSGSTPTAVISSDEMATDANGGDVKVKVTFLPDQNDHHSPKYSVPLFM